MKTYMCFPFNEISATPYGELRGKGRPVSAKTPAAAAGALGPGTWVVVPTGGGGPEMVLVRG